MAVAVSSSIMARHRASYFGVSLVPTWHPTKSQRPESNRFSQLEQNAVIETFISDSNVAISVKVPNFMLQLEKVCKESIMYF
jgi:hypothetical protein